MPRFGEVVDLVTSSVAQHASGYDDMEIHWLICRLDGFLAVAGEILLIM